MPLPTSLLRIAAPFSTDIVIRQGDTLQLPFTIKVSGVAVDLSGFTAACKIRDYYGSATVLATPTVTIPVGTDGVILVSMTPAATAALTALGTPANTARVALMGYYDIDITDATDRVTLIVGQVNLSREITL